MTQHTNGRHTADNNCLARGKDSETRVKPFYNFERRKELDGGTVVEECYFAMKKMRSANQGGGGDANVIFGGGSVRIFRIGYRARLQRNYTNIKARLEILLPQY